MQGNYDNVGDDPGEGPVAVAAGRHVLAISGGGKHYCAVYDDHTLHCWGGSDDGELGLGRTTPFGDEPGETNVGQTDLPPGRTAVAVTSGYSDSCAILDDSTLRCFGRNADGQLGQGNTASVGDDPGESTIGVDVGGPVRAVGAAFDFVCAITDAGLRCWGQGYYLGQGTTIDYGSHPGEIPRLLPLVNLGGQSVGRDRDGDGVRDAVDACPTTPGTLANGCAVVVFPEAVLKGKKVRLNTVLAKKKASAKCPAKVSVTVKTRAKSGRVKVTRLLKAKATPGGCRVSGKVKLPAKPKKTATVKVTVVGTKLVTRHLVAVRA
jgi:hypothetical protein